ncbi:uncharacterized protein TM35_000381800 [Trypanosoma theileri]|uniref:Uncharacterized protein n=1 Tax=Trypanosoma theileri TaxID=67003 RepID=A0A1X0NK46_9TRYP|nr:uncharacterized protein TM35_000381800 [Trypanosoma theileri]ORC85105.1 hypothetical protein TM35_000381800 [Trypanosoma theileri]
MEEARKNIQQFPKPHPFSGSGDVGVIAPTVFLVLCDAPLYGKEAALPPGQTAVALVEFLGNAGQLIAVPRSSTSYCRRKPRASDVFLLEYPLALRLRRYKAPGPAASCWGKNISKNVLGHLPTCYQQYHPHQVTAEW